MKSTTFTSSAFIFFFILCSLSLQAAVTVPTPDHVVIVIMENHAYAQIIGSSSAPHINALAIDSQSALFTHSYAIEHPSQPNYLDFYSGCNQGVVDDNVPSGNPFTTANLGRQLLDAGKTFATYSEDMPSVGYNGASYLNYARKHNPAANWMGTGTNQIPTSTNQPLTAFPSTGFSSLPTVCYVIPNQNDDMHNGTDPARITAGDTWFYTKLNSYMQWAKANNSLLILTFDEDDDLSGNHIATVFCGAMVKPGQYSESINHYCLLRTIEDMFGLSYICNAATATSITDSWLSPAAVTSLDSYDGILSVFPNPFSDETIIQFTLGEKQAITIELYDLSGRRVYSEEMPEATKGRNEFKLSRTKANISSGSYFIQVSTNKQSLVRKILCVE